MGRNLTDNEKRTLEDCLRNLRSLRGCEAAYIEPGSNPADPDALHLKGPWGELDYRVMTRLRLSTAGAEIAINQIKNGPAPDRSLLVTDYITEDLSRKLRQSGIDYVDAAGNASLQRPPLYVEVSGRKRVERRGRSSRAFQPAGLKLVFLLLRVPQAARWTYRDLAGEAGIALGAVGPILRELEELGYLENSGGQRLLRSRHELLLRWELGYGERLQPLLECQRCRLAAGLKIPDLPNLIEQQGLTETVLVGGRLGACLLLQQGTTDGASLHYDGDALRTMLRLQLIPDPNGRIRLLKRFGHADHWQGWRPQSARIADPLLLHAELQMDGADSDDLQQRLFQRYLMPRFAEERIE
ncbi:hypothetical protein [Geothermobacter hydrogeniphilus]|uniref:Uncharacterized protein n=1 Tax=Geothermobacter hydrogeniphilus TaxID=1969733 RepID=A0A1X0XXN6_9BACT|nr:hypothetical protein [Geothermobacter hydrogeniphilus]ORJ57674.1 hypothetical protein B5V00_12950 [Geothermobacter hydrogeniphilus]